MKSSSGSRFLNVGTVQIGCLTERTMKEATCEK